MLQKHLMFSNKKNNYLIFKLLSKISVSKQFIFNQEYLGTVIGYKTCFPSFG